MTVSVDVALSSSHIGCHGDSSTGKHCRHSRYMILPPRRSFRSPGSRGRVNFPLPNATSRPTKVWVKMSGSGGTAVNAMYGAIVLNLAPLGGHDEVFLQQISDI